LQDYVFLRGPCYAVFGKGKYFVFYTARAAEKIQEASVPATACGAKAPRSQGRGAFAGKKRYQS
jgi:hypothetical protein